MQTKELAEQLSPWLPELISGKTLERNHVNDRHQWVDILDITGLAHFINMGCEIRIKQTPIPPAPDGDSWQNPDNLTAEQIGIDEGWRLLLKSELVFRDEKICCEGWRTDGKWSRTSPLYSNDTDMTYRVGAKKYPIGMLRDSTDERLLEQKRKDIAQYFMDMGDDEWASNDLARRLIKNQVPHVGLK